MEVGRTQGTSGAGGVHRVNKSGKPADAAPVAEQKGDKVEISESARYLSQVLNMAPERSERIEEIRRLIDDGRYETPEKLKAAIDRFLNDDGAA